MKESLRRMGRLRSLSDLAEYLSSARRVTMLPGHAAKEILATFWETHLHKLAS
jgi:hypothetical protein